MAAKKTDPEKVPYKVKVEELVKAHFVCSFVLPAVLELARNGNKTEKKVAERIFRLAGNLHGHEMWRASLKKALGDADV